MRIYAVADIHSRGDREKKALDYASSSDLAIICGDITHFGPPDHARQFLDELCSEVRTIAVPGNCDPPEIIGAIEESAAINLHNAALEFGEVFFFGYGGSVPGMIRTIFEIPEETIYEDLKRIAKKGGVMVTHVPPRGHMDLTNFGNRIGSSSVLRIVDEFSPVLHLFGHVHEAAGKERYNGTQLINCSAGHEGYGCYIDLDGGEVKTIEFIENF